MGLFEQLGGGVQMNPQQMMNQLRQNPAATLKQAGMNIPDGMSDPQQIINYLLQTGQVNNPRLQMVQQLAGRFFKR